MEIITVLNKMKENNILESFGEILPTPKSWFIFVKYQEMVHVRLRIDHHCFELFGTFEEVIDGIASWDIIQELASQNL